MQNYVPGNYSSGRRRPGTSVRTRGENGDAIALFIGEPKTLAAENTLFSIV